MVLKSINSLREKFGLKNFRLDVKLSKDLPSSGRIGIGLVFQKSKDFRQGIYLVTIIF